MLTDFLCTPDVVHRHVSLEHASRCQEGMKILATQPIERKRGESCRTFTAPRKFTRPTRRSREWRTLTIFSPEFEPTSLPASLGTAILNWRVSEPGGPLLNRAFPEAGCHVILVVVFAAAEIALSGTLVFLAGSCPPDESAARSFRANSSGPGTPAFPTRSVCGDIHHRRARCGATKLWGGSCFRIGNFKLLISLNLK